MSFIGHQFYYGFSSKGHHWCPINDINWHVIRDAKNELDLSKTNEALVLLPVAVPSGAQSPSLAQMLVNHMVPENFERSCEKCIHNWARKSVKITHYPFVLMIQFKCFDMNGSKNNVVVDIPAVLDYSETLYDLIGSITHLGDHVTSGHYVADLDRNGTVFHFNDACVCRSGYTRRGDAYLVFYKKRDGLKKRNASPSSNPSVFGGPTMKKQRV